MRAKQESIRSASPTSSLAPGAFNQLRTPKPYLLADDEGSQLRRRYGLETAGLRCEATHRRTTCLRWCTTKIKHTMLVKVCYRHPVPAFTAASGLVALCSLARGGRGKNKRSACATCAFWVLFFVFEYIFFSICAPPPLPSPLRCTYAAGTAAAALVERGLFVLLLLLLVLFFLLLLLLPLLLLPPHCS